MSVNHMFKFLDSISGERDQGDAWRGTVEGWEARFYLSMLRPDSCSVVFENRFRIHGLDTGKQSFVDELREMSYSLARIADAAEVVLRESEDLQRGGAA